MSLCDNGQGITRTNSVDDIFGDRGAIDRDIVYFGKEKFAFFHRHFE
jgi:hypothetical protein